MLSIIMLSILVNTCTKETEDSAAPLIEASAIVFNNNLPVDGCAEHIAFVDAKGDLIKAVLPTAASSSMFKNLINAEVAKLPANTYSGNLEIPVVLTYRNTQEKGELECGWGKKTTVELIEIVKITKK